MADPPAGQGGAARRVAQSARGRQAAHQHFQPRRAAGAPGANAAFAAAAAAGAGAAPGVTAARAQVRNSALRGTFLRRRAAWREAMSRGGSTLELRALASGHAAEASAPPAKRGWAAEDREGSAAPASAPLSYEDVVLATKALLAAVEPPEPSVRRQRVPRWAELRTAARTGCCGPCTDRGASRRVPCHAGACT